MRARKVSPKKRSVKHAHNDEKEPTKKLLTTLRNDPKRPRVQTHTHTQILAKQAGSSPYNPARGSHA